MPLVWGEGKQGFSIKNKGSERNHKEKKEREEKQTTQTMEEGVGPSEVARRKPCQKKTDQKQKTAEPKRKTKKNQKKKNKKKDNKILKNEQCIYFFFLVWAGVQNSPHSTTRPKNCAPKQDFFLLK